MALPAGTQWEVRIDGSDSNGGGFVAGSSGTDRSQQSAAQATLSAASVVHSTTTQINVALGDYTVTAADVGNLLQITGGTATAGFYQITAADVPNNRWTMDRSVGTAGQTVIGNMGGALGSPGMVAGRQVSGNTVWIRYSATTYDISSTTANISGGRIAPPIPALRWEGYETVRGDLSTNRPRIRSLVATTTMFSLSSTTGIFGNFILDAAGQAGIICMGAAANTTTHRVKAISGTSASGSFSCASGSALLLCSVQGGTAPGFRMSGSTLTACAVNNCGGIAYESLAGRNTCVFCVADSGTANVASYANTGATSQLQCINCDSYGHRAGTSSNGFTNSGTAGSMMQVNCLAEFNAGTGFGPGNTNHAFNCTSHLNATNFNASVIQFGSVVPTAAGSVFADAAARNFVLNNTAGAGAVLRGAAIPGTMPDVISSIGFLDVGALQHESVASSAVSTVNSRHVLITLPRAWDIE